MSTPTSAVMADRAIDKKTTPEFDDPILNTSWLGCTSVPLSAVACNLMCAPLYCFTQCCGIFVLPERQQLAVLYFGEYYGSVVTPGIHCLPPFGREMRGISTAIRTVNMKNLKVVDSHGNPVVVGAVVTFVATSARKARIDVNNPWPGASWQPSVLSGTYLQLQAQAVLKQVASQFPYEAPPGEASLQTEGSRITEMLVQRLQLRVQVTGAKIISFDMVDLSYAPEIAQSMLLRQQAVACLMTKEFLHWLKMTQHWLEQELEEDSTTPNNSSLEHTMRLC